MTKDQGGDAAVSNNTNARLETSPEDKAKAAKWFERARELGEKRQFDYAIEYYVNGLEFWPDAVEEALKPLHGCAVARRQTGGKKPGFKDTMRRSMNDKDPRKAFVNSLWLFGKDPENANYIEGVVKNANRLHADDAARWSANVMLRALEGASKASSKQFQSLAKITEEVADRAAERGEGSFGVEILKTGVEALSVLCRRSPNDDTAEKALRDLSTKLTILKGKYQDSESYRESIRDTEAQRDLHDEQRSVQAEERIDELIRKAEQQYEANPDDAVAFRKLIDLLTRREQDEDEAKAIGLLVDAFQRTEDYRWKFLADDIRMKQLNRESRRLAKAGDREGLKEHRVKQLRFELGVFKERVERYPTDNRIKFQYGVRNFEAGRFDDAIPLFQTARSDPRNRAACGMYLGRCFFRKGYHDQAVSALEQAIEDHEIPDDDLSKNMHYWLGRSQEALGRADEARKTYGKLLQMDYNFRDVRGRLEELKAG